MTSTFFLFGGLERLILVAVYFERRHCWSANVLEYSEDLQLRPVHMKQQCKTALGLWTQ